jgi:hypothetical protein
MAIAVCIWATTMRFPEATLAKEEVSGPFREVAMLPRLLTVDVSPSGVKVSAVLTFSERREDDLPNYAPVDFTIRKSVADGNILLSCPRSFPKLATSYSTIDLCFVRGAPRVVNAEGTMRPRCCRSCCTTRR